MCVSRRGKGDFRRDRREGGDSAPRREAQAEGRPPRERFKGRDKFQGGKGGRDNQGGGSHRQVHSSAPPRERDRPIDPNSPFAKLAALKEQLASGRKDYVSPRRGAADSGWCVERQRLDKWLWHARVVRARSTAAALVESGHVRINGTRETSPGHGIKVGDVVTIALDRGVRVLKVIGFTERRGDATSVTGLYADLEGPRD